MGPFDIGGLPPELQIHIYSFVVPDEDAVIITKQGEAFKSRHGFSIVSTSPQYHALVGSKSTRRAYLDAMGDHMVRKADVVFINVEDLKFTGFRAFIKAAFRANKLQQFFVHSTDNPGSLRCLEVSHVTSDKLPDTFDNAFSFIKFLTGLMKKVPGAAAHDVRMNHQVSECSNEARLMTVLNTLGARGTMGPILEPLFQAFNRHYNIILHRTAYDKQLEEARFAPHKQAVAAGPSVASGWQQAAGGAEASEEDEDMENANLRGDIEGEYTGMVDDGTQGGWVEEMNEATDQEMGEQMDDESDSENIKEEELEEEPAGTLYDHDQHYMAANYQPATDATTFLGQVFAGTASLSAQPRFVGSW
ncbi:hypothetical protein PRZ48_002575 [Zasmidium cellare]|uniref:Uncharacterized protein n=1 Tax=Zasmidium cellare TaxID=395010 RepID=A0ABR0ET98_ZASCE|nr:hypothetical protein PRZ48_002575 [Zasmidium cellare]